MSTHPNSTAARLELNVPGPFYITEDCIDCDLCRSDAPSVFRRDDESGYTYVYRQPEGAEETSLARESAEACPVEAIQEER